MKIEFVVDGKKFVVDKDVFSGESFIVRSSPRPYRVFFDSGHEAFRRVNSVHAKSAFVLIDEKVDRLYGKLLNVPRERRLKMPATERFKTLPGLKKVWDFLDAGGFSKANTLIVVGGGIMQDAGGFAAACFKRGIKWVHVPTTLLSMCDSCIGAKTGINFGSAKNQLGVFSAPHEVIIDPRFLRTLEPAHIKSGLGEILKMSVIGGPAAMDEFRKHAGDMVFLDHEAFVPLIRMSLGIKKVVVECDEFETGYRKVLNYGHTLGHAIESFTNFRVPHGEAVAMGMILADSLAALMPGDESAELEDFCFSLIEHTRLPKITPDKLGSLVKKDKKAVGVSVTLVAPKKPGDMRFIKTEINSAFLGRAVRLLGDKFGAGK